MMDRTTVLQCNIHGSDVANSLLTQIRSETGADVLLISETYREWPVPTWYSNIALVDKPRNPKIQPKASAAIYVDPRTIRVDGHGARKCFVWVKSRDVTYVSCYFSPNVPMGQFRKSLEELEDAVRDMEGHVVVAGDFNAQALEWGMPRQNDRGKYIMEMASRLGLIVLNEGSSPTFQRGNQNGTIPDVSFVSESLAPRASNWRIYQSDYNGSDHEYITFQILDASQSRRRNVTKPPRWNLSKLNTERLVDTLIHGTDDIPITNSTESREAAEALVKQTMSLIHRACDASMPRKGSRNGKSPAYWWSDEIAMLRKEAHRLRRRAQRARRRPDAALMSALHKEAHKKLRHAINRSKAQGWKDLLQEVNRDVWGLAYKIVAKKLCALPGCPFDEETMARIVNTLFPTHPPTQHPDETPEIGDIHPFTIGELQIAARMMRNKKAPGPDGIPAEVLKLIAVRVPSLLLNMYNACLQTGVFPTPWKVARLVLIGKGKGGDPRLPSSNRPLCMLDDAGKLFERLLKPRLQGAVKAAGDLADNQYGFRKQRSTIDAIKQVVQRAEVAWSGNYYSRPIVLLVTLDVKNAFNSARWSNILSALRKFQVPEYLMRVIRDYLSNRILRYDTEEGQREKQLSAGVAQGSIFGPDFWNILYDALLRLEMPNGVSMVAYADDVALVITARNAELAQCLLNQAMRGITRWMTTHGLDLAHAKTEIVPFTGSRKKNIIFPMNIGDTEVTTRRETVYLGLKLDTKLLFTPHLLYNTSKAALKMAQLSRLMANTSGPKASKRKVLMSVVTSILLYGSEIWAVAMEKDCHRKRVLSVQRRGALRISSAYRTVSGPAVLVIAGVIPIDLHAMERKRIYERKKTEEDKTSVHRQERERTMETWQSSWIKETRGQWTYQLINQLAPWIDRTHGEVNYYLTQFLSGHGYFCSYLSNMGKVRSPGCIFCSADRDDAYHTFFVCEQWNEERTNLEATIGEFQPETIVGIMISDKRKWTATAHFVETVLRKKKRYLDYASDPSTNDAPGDDPTPPHNQGATVAASDVNVEGNDGPSS
jgi:hypothetical protein